MLAWLARPEERRVVDDCYAVIKMPATFGDLLRVKTRWTYGNLELSAVRPDLSINDQDRYDGVLSHVLLRPWLWPHVPAFVFVFLYAHSAARKRIADSTSIWERDDSTRPLPRETRPAA